MYPMEDIHKDSVARVNIMEAHDSINEVHTTHIVQAQPCPIALPVAQCTWCARRRCIEGIAGNICINLHTEGDLP